MNDEWACSARLFARLALRNLDAPRETGGEDEDLDMMLSSHSRASSNYDGGSIRCSIAHILHHHRAADLGDLASIPIRLEDATAAAAATAKTR